MSIGVILIIAFGGAFFTYLLGKISSTLRNLFAVLISLLLVGLISLAYGRLGWRVGYEFLGFNLVLRLTVLSWFFAISIAGIGFLSIVFSLSYMKGRENLDFYYLMMLLVNAGMLGVVFSGDLLSFYIFWEIMSWGTYLLISSGRGKALDAGLKYIIWSIIGSSLMMLGFLYLYVSYGTLSFPGLSLRLSSAPSGVLLLTLILFGIGFGIKNALLPLHTWLPDVYTEAPSPFTAVLSGMLTRMGVYGFLLVMYVLVGLREVVHLGSGWFTFNNVLSWLGAITIVIPTFIALLQNDAKRLLAWSSVGQGGYMILGIAFGTSMGVAGGILHTLGYALSVVLLFMVVGAVEHRTQGIRDLNQLGGLIKKMPLTFIGALIGISGLIGVPLVCPFVSKWLIYKTLIDQGHPILAFAALIGTWGAILYAYKFIHNIFLGQTPKRLENVKVAPFSMQFPMAVLSVIIVLFGILPGIPLKVIGNIESSFGFAPLALNVWGIRSEVAILNTLNIFAAVLLAVFFIFLLFRMGAGSRRVPQEDSYTAGAAPVPADRYHHTVDFYNPFQRIISPYLRDRIDDLYYWIAGGARGICDGIRRIYTGDVGTYALYIVLFLAFLILMQRFG